jgi:AsmA-like C-terminal region
VTNSVQHDAPARSHSKRRLHRILIWVSSILVVLIIAALIAGNILLHHASPVLKAKVIQTLSTRFDSRVQLDKFQVSLIKGFQVSGSGLKLYPNHLASDGPMIAVDRFSFRVLGWRQLLRTPLLVHHVQVSGLSIHIPPKNQRANMPHLQNQGEDQSHAGIKIEVVQIDVDQATLVIENGKPNKVPLNFVIHRLVLKSVAAGQPMKFHATLVNPRPIGNIDSSGDFGPFNADSPGDTSVRGTYSFSHADLNSIKGIGGMLASTGSYQGQLDNITVDGETTTPNFSLDIANHALPLNTKFHAIVDGTNGDTWLQPVDAWLRHTHIIAKGEIVRMPNVQGRDIRLDVTVDPGNIQDLLYLADKAPQPLMNGQVTLHTQFDLPPGPEEVPKKLRLKGSFQLIDIHFPDPKIQSKVDELSLRGQGHPKTAQQEGDALKNGNNQAATAADVASEMRGNFTLGGGEITLPTLNYRVPGAEVALQGTYNITNQNLDFTGKARLDAHVSQMVTGWKSWLLKPVDPFFAKDGAGTQVPLKIGGTSAHPSIGLNF